MLHTSQNNLMHPTTTQHRNPRTKQSPVGTQGLCVRRCAMVGTQRVALRITPANTCTDAPVETLRATSPTHHTPTRDTRDVARYVSTTGNGHANHGQHSAIPTQHVALWITSANTYPDAPVETLRATSPTHHAPTRDTGDVARYVSTTGNGHTNHYQHTAITTQHVASLHGIHQTAWDCGATPTRTRKATSLHQE